MTESFSDATHFISRSGLLTCKGRLLQPAAWKVWSGLIVRLWDHFSVIWLNVLAHHLLLLQHETRVLRVKVIAGIDLAKKDIIGARWAPLKFLFFGHTRRCCFHRRFLSGYATFMSSLWDQRVGLVVALPVHCPSHITYVLSFLGLFGNIQILSKTLRQQ